MVGKVCTKCKRSLPLDGYARNSRSRDGHAWRCKTCAAAYHAARREYVTDRNRARRYGISIEDAATIRAVAACQWCGAGLLHGVGPNNSRAAVLHHDHQTGRVVAVLCRTCNYIEGFVGEAAANAGLSIAEYLRVIGAHMEREIEVTINAEAAA